MELDVRLKKARQELKRYLRPNIIYLVEHARCDVAFEVTWHFIKKAREGGFVCNSLRALVGSAGVKVDSNEYGAKALEFEARDLLSQKVICIEQDGFEYIDEHDRPQIDIKSVASSIFSRLNVRVSGLAEFQNHHDGIVDVMPLPSGVGVKVIVDEFGDAWFQYKASKADDWFRPCASMQSHLDRTMLHLHAKGFVADGFFTGTRLFVANVYYALNRELKGGSFREHNEIAHMLNTKLELGLRLLKVYSCNVRALSTLFGESVLGLQAEGNQGARHFLSRGEVGELSFGMVTKDKKARGTDEQCRDLGWFDLLHLPNFDFLSLQLLGYRQNGGGKLFLGI